MVLGPSHGCGGQGENAPEASPFESESHAEAPLLADFAHRVIDAVLEARAKQLDKGIMELLK